MTNISGIENYDIYSLQGVTAYASSTSPLQAAASTSSTNAATENNLVSANFGSQDTASASEYLSSLSVDNIEEADVENIKELLIQAKSDVSTYKSEVKSLERQLEKLKLQIMQFQQQLQDKKDERSNLINKMSGTTDSDERKKLQNEVSGLDGDCKSIDNFLSEVNLMYSTYTSDLEAATSNLSASEQNVSSLSDAYSQAKTMYTTKQENLEKQKAAERKAAAMAQADEVAATIKQAYKDAEQEYYNNVTNAYNLYNSGSSTPTSVNASQTTDGLLKVAANEIGVSEDLGTNDSLRIREYRGYKSDNPWCASFVSWCMSQTYGSDNPLQFTEAVRSLRSQAQAVNCYGTRDNYTPKPGDIIILDKSGNGDHTGIVEKVENGIVYFIDGNSNNQVKHSSYALTNTYIHGYVKTAEMVDLKKGTSIA